MINETTATEVIGYLDCVGKEISLNGMKFTVVGILEDNDSSLTAAFSSGSMVAYIPYTTLLRLSDSASTEITSFYVSAEAGGDTAAAEAFSGRSSLRVMSGSPAVLPYTAGPSAEEAYFCLSGSSP